MRKKWIVLMLVLGLTAAVPCSTYAAQNSEEEAEMVVLSEAETEEASEEESAAAESTEDTSSGEKEEEETENSKETESPTETTEAETDTASETEEEITEINGWFTGEDGSLYYYVNGEAVTGIYTVIEPMDPENEESAVTENTYYFDDNGVKSTGLITVEADLYYFDPAENGIIVTDSMKTLDGDIYCFDSFGKALKEQMKKIDGSYYYFDTDCKAAASRFVIYRGAKYYFDGNFHMVSDCVKTIDGAVYCIRPDGKITDKAWKKNGSSAYYFGADGKALTGTEAVNGTTYVFNSNGVLQSGLQTIDSALYYYKTDTLGVNNLATGVTAIGSDLYYFDSSYKASVGLKTVGTDVYYFGSDYKAITGLKNVSSATYYFGSDHKAATGWATVGSYCYYFGSGHKALKSTIQNGYKLDSKGRSSTRYKVMQIVDAKTTSSMTKEQKISALWTWIVTNSYTYTRTYEHTASDWVWYTGWTDDFANQLLTNKTGNCFRYAAAFGYMVYEATGYEVRVWEGMTPASRGGLTPHGWINVKIEGTWYAYDPDLYKFGTSKSSAYNKTLVGSKSDKTYHKGTSYVTIK